MSHRPPPDAVLMAAWQPHAIEMDHAFLGEPLAAERVWTGIVDRTGWGEGAWDGEPDGIVWRAAAPPHYRCQLTRNPCLGTLGGYVALPPGHPAHGKPHAELREIEVWGGITFAKEEAEHWVVGFHCANRQDWIPAWTALGIKPHGMPDFEGITSPETIPMLRRLFLQEYKIVAFVRAEVESLAAQLARIAGQP